MAGEPVLLVDDESNIFSLARLYLEREGFSVETAEGGQATLEAISRFHPGLLVPETMILKPP